jgi:hypothetical protein
MRNNQMYGGRTYLGDEYVGDDLVGGEEISGDDGVGDEYVGDEYVGDEYVGDDGLGDEMSGDEMSGDEMSGTEIGAFRPFRRRRRRQRRIARRAPQMASPKQQMAMAKRMENAQVVRQVPHQKSRKQSIGFVFDGLAPNTTVDITSRPQVLFRGTRLLIPSSIGQFIRVEDVKVGRTSQFAAIGAQPGIAYSELSTADNLQLDTSSPGMDVTLRISNRGGAAIDFSATLFGDVVE